MSLVSWHGVHLQLANTIILQEADWQIQPKARIALVGRNGAGKSTLLKLLQGDIVPDKGQIQQQSGLRVAGLPQDVPDLKDALVFEILVQGLGALGQILLALRAHQEAHTFDKMAVYQQQLDDLQAWDSMPRVTMIATKLGLPLDARMGTLSGGMKRRVLLAKALVSAPDLLLLDEPTNHLDIPTMLWLEGYLRAYTGTVVFVTHDRVFLNQVATNIVDLDRGRLHFYTCDYPTFLERREALRLAQQQQHAVFDKRLADEEAWLRTGVKARRTRNEGRVRALEAMRAAHQRRRSQQGQVMLAQASVARAGSVVIAAQQLSYRQIIHNFSLVVQRGDKIGIIGPNGCGKTTLLRLLLGELKPDAGTVRLGTSLEIGYFDQLRQLLDPSKSVMANVADGADHVMIQGKAKHVTSYLRDFLFVPEQYQQPVSSLSGGECNRLLLAKLLAKPANLLVMDEPTNDLDSETLELLENWLMHYSGTLLLISHDRAFINQVVTSVVIYEDDCCFHEYVGDYDSYLAYQTGLATTATVPALKPHLPPASGRLSYSEQRELAQLPGKIERLEQQIYCLQDSTLSATFYELPLAQRLALQRDLAAQEAQLAALYLRWEDLEKRQT